MDAALYVLGPVEQQLFEENGVLRPNAQVPSLFDISSQAIELFVYIAGAGDDGLPVSRIPKYLKPGWSLLATELESFDLIERQRGAIKRSSTYLVLTWKGESAIEQARSQSALNTKRPSPIHARRKALST